MDQRRRSGLRVPPPGGEATVTPILQLEALRVDYRVRSSRGPATLTAVRGVDLSVGRGEALALVGESGSGKSTLGRAALRRLEPTEGRVILDGVDVTRLSQAGLRPLRRRAQLIFQDPYASLDPRMTVGQQIAEALWIHRLTRRGGLRRRVGELLEQVGLAADVADRFPNALSGGQRQRLGIARALAVEPELLILDEPVSALDVSIQAQIINLLADLKARRQLSYLFITHDLRLVHHLADRVAVLYLGRVVEEGPCGEIFASARHPYTRLLLGALPSLTGRAPSPVPEVEPPSPFEPPSGCAFHPRCPLAFDRCRSEAPRLVALGSSGARAACFVAERDEASKETAGA